MEAHEAIPSDVWVEIWLRCDGVTGTMLTSTSKQTQVSILLTQRPLLRKMRPIRLLAAAQGFSSILKWYGTVDKHAMDEQERRRFARVTAEATLHGSLECLETAVELGYPMHPTVAQVAAMIGRVDCLKYAHENGCDWSYHCISLAADIGSVECVKYAHENGCKWSDDATWRAARHGHLPVVVYLHENGCEWDPHTTYIAAYNGFLDCLAYAYQHGCPFHYQTTVPATMEGHLECLKYAHENGAPFDAHLLSILRETPKNRACIQYARDNI